MDFQFTEEQQQLADSVARLIERDYDFESRRNVLRSGDGYSPAVWQSIAEMGVIGVPLSEANGGFGMGALALVPVMEQVGRGLLLEPIASTLVCARLLERAGGEAWGKLLEQAIGGQVRLALAHLEAGGRYDDSAIATTATRTGDGWRLQGAKSMVVDAPHATHLVVSARVSGAPGDRAGIALFVVQAEAKGVHRRSMRTIDGVRAADVSFEDCMPGGSALVVEDGFEALQEALDFASVLACAEATGAMAFANDTTLDYLKTRKQFGVPIGAFQALQHRMVDMTISAEQSRSITYLACDAVDRAAKGEIDARERSRLVSAARIKVGDAARHVGQEAIQLHGGMGMTDEMKISHTFKRLTMLAQVFGDTDHHLERFAATDR